MSKRITIRCVECGNQVTYNIRNGAKPNKTCNNCDQRKLNVKTDHAYKGKKKRVELY